jgi:hypothetical protein
MKTLRAIVFMLALTAFSAAFAQQSVAPPPKPAIDAPANAEVLKLLQIGMPESVVLNKIRITTDKFDTSADALVALKQAGATEAELKAVMAQGAAPTDAPLNGAPASTGPSLAETMQYIQERLNDLGKVSYVEFNQNTIDGSTFNSNFVEAFSNVVADQNQCRIAFHKKGSVDGTAWEFDTGFSLRDVQEIVVKPYEQYQTEGNAKNGRPNIINTSINPPLTALLVRGPHGVLTYFPFTEANLADRVARALTRAVELCGGGNKDKF